MQIGIEFNELQIKTARTLKRELEKKLGIQPDTTVILVSDAEPYPQKEINNYVLLSDIISYSDHRIVLDLNECYALEKLGVL